MPTLNRTHLAVAAAIVCGLAGYFAGRMAAPGAGSPAAESAHRGEAASNAAAQEAVVGMGRIEPAGGVIDVGATMGDRLGPWLVKEGDTVKKGAPLAELESRDLRGLQLDAAHLNVKKAEAAALGMAAHQEKIDLLKDRLSATKKDQERIEGLSKDLVTDQERERQALLVQQAASELDSARVATHQLERANELGVEAAQLELKTAKTQYDRTQITAPCDGTILKTYVRSGETIGGKPILQMANPEQMVVVVEVYENEIKHVREGQQALVTSKAFPSPYDEKGLHGKVTRIGKMINAPVLKNIDPFASADRHVVEVRVELDAEGSRQSAALSNLQVDVRFLKRD